MQIDKERYGIDLLNLHVQERLKGRRQRRRWRRVKIMNIYPFGLARIQGKEGEN